jgi:murein DD-endopeptidase MepM/ murein hydrolase activator NlpD
MQETKEPPLPLIRLKQTGKIISKSFQFPSKKAAGMKKLLFKFLQNNHIGRKIAVNLGLLLLIALIPPIAEYSSNKQVYTDLKKYSEPLDPIRAGELAENISPYTPGVSEKSDEVAIAMMLENDSYSLSQQLSVNAGKDIDGPERAEAVYEVKSGETIMQIAEKFNLHVASLLDANGIRPEDAKKVKVGTVLNIPSSDTSTSSEWMVAVNQAEEAERKAAEEKRLAELKKKQIASSKLRAGKAYAASSSRYEGVDRSGIIVPISHNGISRGYSPGHRGIDYRASIGTPVRAAAGGKVISVSGGWGGGYGNQILVDHGGGRVTRYAHLSGFAISAGTYVAQGQTIGYSGNTGRSTGPHLHFELIINGSPVPPF